MHAQHFGDDSEAQSQNKFAENTATGPDGNDCLKCVVYAFRLALYAIR